MMGTSEFQVITLSTLHRLFHGMSVGEVLAFEDIRCVRCGKSISIKIQKTAGGYGFVDGIISEPSCSSLLARCSKCNDLRD
jgi:hypothetical protein